MRLALAQVRPDEHHRRAGRGGQQDQAGDVGRICAAGSSGREQPPDEERAEQRHRERLHRPVDEQRDADAAPVLAHLAERAEVDLEQHRDDHQPDQYRRPAG